jgi:16S rRNA (adenine1518-N6/adenine1519-N6)-dimethyltransferase
MSAGRVENGSGSHLLRQGIPARINRSRASIERCEIHAANHGAHSDTSEICSQPPRIATLGVAMARQRLGQHFLGDMGWRKRILATLPLRPNDIWVEIGPGHGEMTQFLAGEGRRVIAIEADPKLAEGLRASTETQPAHWPGVEVFAGDVLATDIGRLATGNFHVYGNLPYYITSPILHHLFRWAGQISSIHIVIQLEVAERIVARPNVRDYGYLSTFCQFYTRPKIALRIPSGAFRPPPKVKSALVSLVLPGERTHLDVPDAKRFLEFVQACFAQKRKTLRNNLLEIAGDQEIHEALAAAGLRSDARAEQLTLAQFAALFSRLVEPNPAGLPGRHAAGRDNSS